MRQSMCKNALEVSRVLSQLPQHGRVTVLPASESGATLPLSPMVPPDAFTWTSSLLARSLGVQKVFSSPSQRRGQLAGDNPVRA